MNKKAYVMSIHFFILPLLTNLLKTIYKSKNYGIKRCYLSPGNERAF